MANYDDDPMQAQLGLSPGMGSSGSFGFQTPPPPPYVRHPGEASQDIVQRTQSQAAMTMQTAMMNRPGVLSTGASGMGQFAQQYSANMASMNQQMFNPFVAQTMASMGGYQGFQQGMMPSPVQMTSPQMGIFRSFPQAPTSSFPPTPPLPLMAPINPFAPRIPDPSFSTPMDFGYSQAHYRGMQTAGAFTAAPGVAARAMTDVGMSYVGGGIGALMGARLGGARGAALGSTVGSLAGLIGGDMGGFGSAAQRITDRFNPFGLLYSQGHAMQSSSQNYVVGGSDLEVTGRGLTGNSSRHLAMGLRNMSRAMPATGDSFTNADMLKMTHLAGQNGMLNMSQSSDQIVTQMKTVAKSMKVFMQLAGEPDMRAAMKSMGQLYSMGVSVPEMTGIARDAKMYSKMAGTSFQGIMQSGLSGAEIFQANGLTAGLGLRVGMGSMGMAQQAVAGGAYSPQLLAMQGGVQGIAQREMMSQAATLRMPMMAAAVANFSNGAFGMNGGTANGMAQGQFNMGQLTTMGANNLMNAVNKGGIGALGMYKLQEPMLQDQLGRQLGPMGLKNMSFQNVLQNMKMLGLSGEGGFATVASSLYGADSARDMVAQGSSPEFFANMQRQIDVQRSEGRGMAFKKLKQAQGENTFAGKYLSPTNIFRRSAGLRRMANDFDEGMENIAAAFDFTEENAAEANGQVVTRTPSRLLASKEERSQMSKLSVAHRDRVISGANAAARGGAYANNDPLGYTASGEAYGQMASIMRSSDLKDAYNTAHGGGLWQRYKDYHGTSREEMEEFMEDAGKVGASVAAGKNATVSQQTAVRKRLSAAGVTTEQRLTFARELSRIGKEGTKGDQHALTQEQVARAAKSAGISDKVDTKDLLLSESATAATLGGSETATAFAGISDPTDRNNVAAKTSLLGKRTNLLRGAMGSEGSEAAKEKLQKILFSAGDDRAAAYAVLMFSSGSMSAAKVLDEVPEGKERDTVQAKGDKILKEIQADPELHGPAKAFADTIREQGSANNVSASEVAGGVRKELLQTKQIVLEAEGLQKMGLSTKESFGTSAEVMKSIQGNADFLNKNQDLRKVVDEYFADGTSDERKAELSSKVLNRAGSVASGTGTGRKGGIFGGDEAMLDRLSNDLGMTAEQMQGVMQNGSPLERSAIQLDYAANKLMDAATSLSNHIP